MRIPSIHVSLALGTWLVVAATGPARAQPVEPWPDPPPADQPGEEPADQPGDEPADQPAPPPIEDATTAADQPVAPPTDRPATPEPLVRPAETLVLEPARDQLELPVLFDGATGHLLPAGVIMTTAGIDTGGALASDLRIGLGDVAEFGIGTTDLIRAGHNCAAGKCDSYDAVSPYPLALFKMGVSENRLFDHQPAVAIGFRTTFERHHDARSTRVAELYVVASKQLGSRVNVHAGGVFWDASIAHGDDSPVFFHDEGLGKQLRPFGGIELQPLPRSRLLLEWVWVPEFQLGQNDVPDRIKLRPMFAWGVRYELTSWAMIESGVRIPNIGDINLLDAQIFGQLKLVSHRFSRFLDGLH